MNEYSDLDMTDGYIVYPSDGALRGAVSYPKFQTDEGTYISLRDGIWDPIAGTYDRAHLKLINIPVLKSHSAEYGITACVKNYMGVVSGVLGTDSHIAIEYGILGALLGEIGPADLNILDSIWVNARPSDGPWTSYAVATRRDELVASIDPVAADIWAAKNILIPAFLDNGYSPPWPDPSADPDDSTSDFRTYLDNSMNYILAAGYEVTNNPDQIDAFSGDGGAGDFNGAGDVDIDDYNQFADCFTGVGGGPIESACQAGDFDGDDDVDCWDWDAFASVWTSVDDLPAFSPCVRTVPTVSAWGVILMTLLMLTAGTIVIRTNHGRCAGDRRNARLRRAPYADRLSLTA